MLRNYEWVDSIFIQFTAWFLQHDIIIVTTSSTEDHPYITISGNLDDERIPCQGIPLTIGTKSNIHYQSLLPIEERGSRNRIKPSSPEDTIKLKLSAAKTSAQSRAPNLGSKEEFPNLEQARSKPEASTSRKEIPKSRKKDQQRASASGKDINSFNHIQKKENPEKKPFKYQEYGEKAFKYMLDSTLLEFQFVSEKRVKCPRCNKEYKNILLHIQKSSCISSNLDDLCEKFKEHIKVNLDQKIKDGQRKRTAKSRAKQQKVAKQEVLDDQNRWKRKSTLKQREVDNQRVLDDQVKRKQKSTLKKREVDNQKVLDDQVKWKQKSVLKQREPWLVLTLVILNIGLNVLPV